MHTLEIYGDGLDMSIQIWIKRREEEKIYIH